MRSLWPKQARWKRSDRVRYWEPEPGQARLRDSNSHQLILWATLLPFLAWKSQDNARVSLKKPHLKKWISAKRHLVAFICKKHEQLDLSYITAECQGFFKFYNILLPILCIFANLTIYCLLQAGLGKMELSHENIFHRGRGSCLMLGVLFALLPLSQSIFDWLWSSSPEAMKNIVRINIVSRHCFTLGLFASRKVVHCSFCIKMKFTDI